MGEKTREEHYHDKGQEDKEYRPPYGGGSVPVSEEQGKHDEAYKKGWRNSRDQEK